MFTASRAHPPRRHAARRAGMRSGVFASGGGQHGQHGQRGVYAIEFGIVFLFLFAALYALLCYGILFAVRLGLQNAAEEAARAGLRYQPTVAQRLSAARAEANLRLNWMKYPAVLSTQVCQVGASGRFCTDGTALTQCRSSADSLCQIVVSISYAPYADKTRPWLPPLPDPLLPDGGRTTAEKTAFTLNGRASMLLDHRGS